MGKETDLSHLIQELEKTIANLEAQRSTLGDTAVETAILSLREKQAQMAAAVQPAQQRKIATILFLDIVNSTLLTQGLDPEEKITLLESALLRLSKPVTMHGGHVVRYQGDGFKAVFGLPTARENDPEHAVRAGLEIQAAAGVIASEVKSSHGPVTFQVRIGIDTGMVVVGGVTEGQDTIDGAAVVMSARLESTAPPEELLISHNTYRHIRGLFDVQEQEPLLAKGFSQPVRVYRVLRVKSRPFYMARREFEGVETHTIGREAELLTLQNAYLDVAEGHETRLVTIVGDAGIGKSRLLYEFENWVLLLQEVGCFYKGRAAPENLHHSAGLWHDLFSSHFEILDTDSATTMRKKFIAGMADQVHAEETPVIGQLVGFDFGHLASVQSALKDPLFDQMGITYLAKYFRTLAENNPVLLLLEDVHWADDRSLDLLDRLLTALSDCRLLVICLARPGLFERRPEWGSGQVYSTRLDLKPLSVRHSRLLVDEILQMVKEPPQELREVLAREAEGNPFYLEELVKMLLDQGVIQRGIQVDEPWQIELGRLQEIKLPDTLAGVMQARLDGLPEAEKDVLRRASVIGRLFWDRAVDYLGEGGVAYTPLGQVWSSLRSREIVFHRERSVFKNTEEYIFKHALLREAVYESVLRRVRREYHKRAALWLILESAGRSGEFAGLIADHWSLAEESVQEAEWQFQAGKWAATRYAHTEALDRLQRVLDLSPEADIARRFELLDVRERIYELQGRREAQANDLTKLEELAGILGDPDQQAKIALRTSTYSRMTYDFPSAIAYAQQALEKSIFAGNLEYQAEAYLAWGSGLSAQGEYSQAHEMFDRARELAQRGGFQQTEMDALTRFASLANDFEQRKTYLERGLKIAQQIGDRRREARYLLNIGGAIAVQGQFAEAKDYYVRAIRIAHDIGARSDEANFLVNFGYLAQKLGEKTGLKEYQLQAQHILHEIGDHNQEIEVIDSMGSEEVLHGNLNEARQYFSQELSLAKEFGDHKHEMDAFYQIANTYLLQHNYQTCLDMVRGNLYRSTQQDDRFGECAGHLLIGWSLAGLGEYDRAEEACNTSLKIARQAEIRYWKSWGLIILSWITRKKKRFTLAVEYAKQAIDESHQLNQKFLDAFLLTQLGYALLDLQQVDPAMHTFQDGMQVCLEEKMPALMIEKLAGLAKAMLEKQEHKNALQLVEEILTYIHSNNLDRTFEPMSIYLACYQVLQATQDPRAGQILQRAHSELLERASMFDTQYQKSFLKNVPENLAVLALWDIYAANNQ